MYPSESLYGRPPPTIADYTDGCTKRAPGSSSNFNRIGSLQSPTVLLKSWPNGTNGSFHILHRIGQVVYEFELPPSSRTHPIFHISLLKRYVRPPLTLICPLPDLEGPTSKKPLGILVQCRIPTVDRERTKF
ncbi:hypothetical protein Salat_1462500 [Sesamum alatum]|uniref:Tf2-1-like SH3-like domain-containing protein n=1 Tax=Sesamum alatum TaxID=300844 RepID=A0AAE1YB91_9LAMI|nr:hypothetical protein Salat_1462500 [Sesamum alatum]